MLSEQVEDVSDCDVLLSGTGYKGGGGRGEGYGEIRGREEYGTGCVKSVEQAA